ncbi:MAG: cytochrome ubiquinol oxidase subunit I [Azospirillaceae bacterium]
MDALILSRIQFGFTIGFHILFPTLTIGLAMFLVFLEGLWLKTGNEQYRRLYRLWVKIFALAFGMGVVSGIVLSYEFGTNFAEFSRATAPVLGPLLAIEVLTAFFVEAGFIGIMLFGWERVGNRLHFVATVLVALGTLNSAFWILAANSWMHTPAGFEMVDGQFHPADWWAVIFNPSMPYRLAHMVTASFLTVSFVVAGVSAYHLLRGIATDAARKGLSLAMWMALVLAPAQIFIGDLHGLNVLEHQPIKVAAMEGNWETRAGAPLLLFAWPDEVAQANDIEIGIPHLASLILTHDWNGTVPGLTEVPPEDQPPVAIVFFAFRIMVGLGFIMLGLAVWGAVARWRGRFYRSRWLQRCLVAAIPAGFIATVMGWITAEVGRQPYTVYGLLRTADSLSPVAAGAVAWSLATFVVVYALVFAAFLFFVHRVVRNGPEPAPDKRQDAPEAMRGARPVSAVVSPAEGD